MKLKVCGMRDRENIKALARLNPDYLGFIFYEKSPRNFEGDIPTIPNTIKKTAVFVDASIDFILEKVRQYNFKAIQLHGNETPAFCKNLQSQLEHYNQQIKQNTELNGENTEPAEWNTEPVEVWKVFSIKDEFDFDTLGPYESSVDYFLFDTKGKEKGGNGYTFDWSVLEDYPSSTRFVLSGGIGLNEVEKIKAILKTDLPIHAVDVNSRFETTPGLKNIEELEKFIKQLFPNQKRNKKIAL